MTDDVLGAALDAAIDSAIERVAIEAVPWIPEIEGDRIVIRVVQVGWFSILHDPKALFVTGELIPGKPIPTSNGEKLEGTLFRMGFVGTVMKAQGEQYLPLPGDIVISQCLGKRTNRTEGMDPYKLTQTVVLNPNGQPKVPADMRDRDRWVQRVDTATGEILSADQVGLDRLALRPGEQAFPDDLGDAATEVAKSGKSGK